MKRLVSVVPAVVVLALAAASPVLADGPSESNGWRWMSSAVAFGPACHGVGDKLYCFWGAADKTLVRSTYANGAFPAPASVEGQVTAPPSVGGFETRQLGHLILGVRGTDNAVWIRIVDDKGSSTTWGSWGGIAKSRPACTLSQRDTQACVVQGVDDGLYIAGRLGDGKFVTWVRVDDADGKVRRDTRSGPAIWDHGSGGHGFLVAYLGKEVAPGKRELWVGSASLGGTRASWWIKVADVQASMNSDLNCMTAQNASQVRRCVVRTADERINVITFKYDTAAPAHENLLAKPAGRMLLDTPTMAAFIGSGGRPVTMLGIRTVPNMMWMRTE